MGVGTSTSALCVVPSVAFPIKTSGGSGLCGAFVC